MEELDSLKQDLKQNGSISESKPKRRFPILYCGEIRWAIIFYNGKQEKAEHKVNPKASCYYKHMSGTTSADSSSSEKEDEEKSDGRRDGSSDGKSEVEEEMNLERLKITKTKEKKPGMKKYKVADLRIFCKQREIVIPKKPKLINLVNLLLEYEKIL